MADTINPHIKLSDGFSGQRSVVIPRIILDEAASDTVLSTLHITAIGYYPKASNHYRHRDTSIDDFILFYCSDGKGWFNVNGNSYEVKPDSFFILPAGYPHSYGANLNDPWTIYWFHFRGTLASCFAEGCLTPFRLNPSAAARSRSISNLFEEIFNVLDRNFNVNGMRLATALFHHYLGLIRFIRDSGDDSVNHAEQDIIEQTINYLEQNIERPLTLSMLSEYTGFSSSYLSALFKQKTGHPPLAFFNILKIKHASRLLSETDMKINTICHKVGIRDPYYFSRLFTKIMGMTPTAYRTSSTI